MMAMLAHHAGEQSLIPLLLLLGSGGFSLLLAIGRARLVATRPADQEVARLATRLGAPQDPSRADFSAVVGHAPPESTPAPRPHPFAGVSLPVRTIRW
jgi:hypothetical protein